MNVIESAKFSIPKSARKSEISNNSRSTPGHAYYPQTEKIPGSYLSSDHSSQFKSKLQRRTSFSSNIQVPDLNLKLDESTAPGVGTYILNKNTIGCVKPDPVLPADPAYSMPRASRDVVETLANAKQTTPGHAWLPPDEKIPGHYSAFKVGRRTSFGASKKMKKYFLIV